MSGRFALITNDRVVNITNSDSDFLQTLVDSEEIDAFVLLDPEEIEPHIGDSYLDGVFSTYIPPLAEAKATILAAFAIDVQQYIDDRYSLLTRIQFINLYILAKFQSLTTRSVYIEPGLAWINSILAYVASFSISVNSQTDAATVLAMTWNITANVLANPNLTLGAAVQLTSVTPTVSIPSRTLDTNFTLHATHLVMVFYTIRIVSAELTPTGSVELRSDTNATPTTVRSRVAFTQEMSTIIDLVLSYLVPAGHNVRLVSAGTATISIIAQNEVTLTAT